MLIDSPSLEPELEALLLRLVPDMSSRWQSASEHDIKAIEQIAGGELPRCYRWLLLRLGTGLNQIGYRDLDFSARTIVEGYASGVFPQCERMLCIAKDNDRDGYPQLRYYDVHHPTKEDAAVFTLGPENDLECEFETLRELIASAVFDNYRLRLMPFQCEGVIVNESEGDVLEELIPLFEELGFYTPISCGPLCLLYDNGTLAFSSYRSPSWFTPYVVSFKLAGPSIEALHNMIDTISISTKLAIKRLSWKIPR